MKQVSMAQGVQGGGGRRERGKAEQGGDGAGVGCLGPGRGQEAVGLIGLQESTWICASYRAGTNLS